MVRRSLLRVALGASIFETISGRLYGSILGAAELRGERDASSECGGGDMLRILNERESKLAWRMASPLAFLPWPEDCCESCNVDEECVHYKEHDFFIFKVCHLYGKDAEVTHQTQSTSKVYTLTSRVPSSPPTTIVTTKAAETTTVVPVTTASLRTTDAPKSTATTIHPATATTTSTTTSKDSRCSGNAEECQALLDLCNASRSIPWCENENGSPDPCAWATNKSSSVYIDCQKPIDMDLLLADAPRITTLRIQEQSLINLPSSLGALTALKQLDVSHNDLAKLPESIGDLSQLEDLIVADNKLEELPPQLCNLPMTKCNMTNNAITASSDLPSCIMNLCEVTPVARENGAFPRLAIIIFVGVVAVLGTLGFLWRQYTSKRGGSTVSPDSNTASSARMPVEDVSAMAVAQENPPSPRQEWFSSLFGFSETSYSETKRWLRVVSKESGSGSVLESLANGSKYDIGAFDNPTLFTLRQKGADVQLPGRLTVSNIIGDAAELHAAPENHSATFQVASQFNCLEFVGPQVVPEDGVTGYRNDRTQGPACSIACGPATVFRNYFAPVTGAEASSTSIQEGQTRDRMINNLADMSTVLGNDPEGRMFIVQGGYTMATDEQLAVLNAKLTELDEAGAIDTARAAVRVGVHENVQVTATEWGSQRVASGQHVTQVFGSACAVAYNRSNPQSWDRFASLVLEASYEATLWAALLNAWRHGGAKGSRRVFLTALGGGVFGNSMETIAGAMRRACDRFKDYDLDVRIVTHSGQAHPLLQQLERDLRGH